MSKHAENSFMRDSFASTQWTVRITVEAGHTIHRHGTIRLIYSYLQLYYSKGVHSLIVSRDLSNSSWLVNLIFWLSNSILFCARSSCTLSSRSSYWLHHTAHTALTHSLTSHLI